MLTKVRIVLAAALLLFVYAVFRMSVPVVSWEDTNEEGVLLENNQRSKVVLGKGETALGHRVGGLAFLDLTGKRLNFNKDISEVIDAYLPKLPPIASLLPSPEADFNTRMDKGSLPYSLHLLTISPIVVLAVPRTFDKRDGCGGGIIGRGIVPSSLLTDSCYKYLAQPEIHTGSFWFSPELATGVRFLPDGQKSHAILLNGSLLELIANGNEWDIQRRIVVPCTTNPTGCVQEQPQLQSRYNLLENGVEVVDTKTGYIWRRCLEGMGWDGKSCTGTIDTYGFIEAQTHAKQQANTSGKNWHVPTMDELVRTSSYTNKPAVFPRAEATGNACWVAVYGYGREVSRTHACDEFSDPTPALGNNPSALRLVRNAH